MQLVCLDLMKIIANYHHFYGFISIKLKYFIKVFEILHFPQIT